MQIEG